MSLIYKNTDKGIVMSILGGIVVSIYITLAVLITLLEAQLPFFKQLMGQISFIIAGQRILFYDLFWVVLILYLFEVLDGFLDGILMNCIKILVLLLIYFILLQAGSFIIIFSIQTVSFSIFINLTLILTIFIIVYIFVIFCEVIIIEIKTHPLKKMYLNLRNKRRIKQGKTLLPMEGEELLPKPKINSKWNKMRKKLKKRYKWVDFKDDYINFEEDEKLLIKDWITLKCKNKKSAVRFFIIDTVILFFFGFLYGIISYYVYDLPLGTGYYNNFFLGLFFPTWLLLFTGFISLRHYLRAFVYIYVVITIQIFLREHGLITIDGFFLFSIIIQILSMFLFNISSEINKLSTPEITGILYFIIGIVLVIEFLILLLNLGIKRLRGKVPELDVIITNKHLFIRKKRAYNNWRILFIFLGLTIFPYNPSSYNAIYQKVQYKKESLAESWYWDYGKLSYAKSIFELKKYKQNKFLIISEIVLIFIIGIFTVQYFFGIIIIIFGIRELRKLKTKTDTTYIKLRYFRHRAKGSYFKLSTMDTLLLYNVPIEVADTFQTIAPRFSWVTIRIFLDRLKTSKDRKKRRIGKTTS